MLRFIVIFSAAATALWLAAGCAGTSGDEAASAPATAQPGSVQSPGKGGAPVALETAARYEAQPGETFDVALTLVTSAPADALSVAINADEGLALRAPLVRHELGARAPGRIALPPLTVTAVREGRASINLSIEVESAGQRRLRYLSVPVTVGDATAARKRSDVQVEGDGERVRVLPGVERP